MKSVVCKKDNMKNVESIISDLGGNSVVAGWLNVGASTVSEMKRRKSIPVEYWPGLISLSSDKGGSLTNDVLVDAHTKAKADTAA